MTATALRGRVLSVAVLTALALALIAWPPGSDARVTKRVTVGDIFFKPTTLTVRRGTRVRWVWTGDLPHNVTVVRGRQRFKSPTQTSGSFSRILRRRGRMRLICTVHGGARQSMRITVR